MTLQDLCEPLFLYMCRVSRRVRAGELLSAREVRDALIATLADLRGRTATDHYLRAQFEQVEPALLLFIDEAVRAADWPFSRSWQELPQRAHVAAETDRFFAMVDESLADPDDSATERLTLFHTCISLAFLGRPGFEYAREKLGLISLRLAAANDSSAAPPITTDLTRRTRRILAPLAVTVLGSTAAVVAAQLHSYYRDARQLHSAIRAVADGAKPPPTAEPGR